MNRDLKQAGGAGVALEEASDAPFGLGMVAQGTALGGAGLGQENILDDVWLTKFRRGEQETAVIWKSAGAADLRIETAAPVEFEDLYGNPFRLSPIGGEVWLTVGEDPIYLLAPSEARRFSASRFGLAEHDIEVQQRLPLRLKIAGDPPEPLAATVESGLMARPHSVTDLAAAHGLDLQADSDAVEGETYSAVVWLGDRTRPAGRLEAAIRLTKELAAK